MELTRVPISELVSGTAWSREDAAAAAKLEASLRRWGQLRPVLVALAPTGDVVVVEGHRLLRAARAIGWTECDVLCVAPPAAYADVGLLRLALEVQPERDYAAIAHEVARMLAEGRTVAELAAAGPFPADRVTYMDTLTRFDWRLFAAPDAGQGGLSWDLPEVSPAGEPEAAAPVLESLPAVKAPFPDVPEERPVPPADEDEPWFGVPAPLAAKPGAQAALF